MKKFTASLIFLILSIPLNIFADPGEMDTLKIDSITCYPGGSVILPVYIFNDELLSGIEIVFEYDPTYLSIDTFSFDGGHLEFIDEQELKFLYDPKDTYEKALKRREIKRKKSIIDMAMDVKEETKDNE